MFTRSSTPNHGTSSGIAHHVVGAEGLEGELAARLLDDGLAPVAEDLQAGAARREIGRRVLWLSSQEPCSWSFRPTMKQGAHDRTAKLPEGKAAARRTVRDAGPVVAAKARAAAAAGPSRPS
jgi:hypothetical protein